MAEDTVWNASIFGELEILKKLCENEEAPIHEADDRGFTPLCWAARNGHNPVLTYLIDKKCSMEQGSFAGMKPLHHACNKNLESTVKLLLAAGAEVNGTDDNLDMPLHWAASRGVLNIVVALLAAGADINAANAQGISPLHKAAMFGQLAIIKNLSAKGADLNTVDSVGDSALHMAARGGFAPVVKHLIAANAAMAKNAAGELPVACSLNAGIKALFPAAE